MNFKQVCDPIAELLLGSSDAKLLLVTQEEIASNDFLCDYDRLLIVSVAPRTKKEVGKLRGAGVAAVLCLSPREAKKAARHLWEEKWFEWQGELDWIRQPLYDLFEGLWRQDNPRVAPSFKKANIDEREMEAFWAEPSSALAPPVVIPASDPPPPIRITPPPRPKAEMRQKTRLRPGGFLSVKQFAEENLNGLGQNFTARARELLDQARVATGSPLLKVESLAASLGAAVSRRQIAQKEGERASLSRPDRGEVINLIRDYYAQPQFTPPPMACAARELIDILFRQGKYISYQAICSLVSYFHRHG